MNSIARLKSKHIKTIVLALENANNSIVGKFILANEDCFRSVFIEKIMKKTAAVTIDVVLARLKLPEGVIKEHLKMMYDQYLVIY